MGEFKGTNGEAKILEFKDVRIVFLGQGKPQFECWGSKQSNDLRDYSKENSELIRDAFNVRQQINCDLPELLEQRNEFREMLKRLVISVSEGYPGIMTDWIIEDSLELIKKSE